MSLYVSPDQLMSDRAEFARKGIAKGRSVVVASCAEGVVFIAENPSPLLHKVSEIYDRIGFAAVGRYAEFESLRISGIQYADLRGYTYDRRDVTARGLANQYARTLSAAFAASSDKPFEVELAVAGLGFEPETDELFTISFDGTVSDHRTACVLGARTESISTGLAGLQVDMDLRTTIASIRSLLDSGTPVEVGLLDRDCARTMCFGGLDLIAMGEVES